MIAFPNQDNFALSHLPPRSEWPELLFDSPALQYPQQLNCAHELLKKAARYPNKIALIGAHQTLTYAQLQAQVNQISHVLKDQMQLVPGNRVLLRGANNPMLVASVLAVWQVGCIAVLSVPMLRAKELGFMLDKAQISAALCSTELKEELLNAQAHHAVLQKIAYYGAPADASSLENQMQKQATDYMPYPSRADEVCLIAFTSGTTGNPKATMHFHRDVLAVCDCFPVSTLRSRSDDIFIGTSPLAFTFGLGGLALFPLRVGATGILLEKITPESLLRTIQQYRATICFTVPTFYRQMLPLLDEFDLSSLRRTVSAGEVLSRATRTAWRQATGLSMIDGIGTTEMLHIFISAADDAVRPGAIGKAIPGYQACILDADGKPAAAGVVGRLAVKGPTGCRYLDDARQADYVWDGWNVTGDMAEMDQDGYFWYRARADGMIISAGYNIAASEVEEVLLQHPAVAECAVIGAADEERGQIVKAYIVARPEWKADDALARVLQAHVKETIAPYKYPRVIAFLERLPRTETGKVQHFKLREIR